MSHKNMHQIGMKFYGVEVIQSSVERIFRRTENIIVITYLKLQHDSFLYGGIDMKLLWEMFDMFSLKVVKYMIFITY